MTDQTPPENDSNQKNSPGWLIYAVLGIVGLVVGIIIAGQLGQQNGASQRVQIEAGTVLPNAGILPPFELIDDNGKAFDVNNLKGKWTFLFVGYTFCPDICPTTLDLFNKVHTRLSEGEGGVDDTRFVFMSVDPQRDTPARLKEYVRYFNKDFIGVTGDKDTLDTLTRALGAVYMKVEGDDKQNYLIDHSSAIFLINPDGNYHAVFTSPHELDKIVTGFNKIRQSRS